MTAATPIASARLILNDSSVSPRWTDAVLLGYEIDCIREIRRCRPDVAMEAAGTLDTFSTLASTAATFPLGDEWASPVAAYIAGKALAEDDADKENLARSQMRMAEYKEALYGAR
jgi:hypothetical protein